MASDDRVRPADIHAKGYWHGKRTTWRPLGVSSHESKSSSATFFATSSCGTGDALVFVVSGCHEANGSDDLGCAA